MLEAHPVHTLVNRRDELDARDRSPVEDVERLVEHDQGDRTPVPDVLAVRPRMALEQRPLVDVQVPVGDADGEVAECVWRDVDAADGKTVALHRREGSIVPDDVGDRITRRHVAPPPPSYEMHGRTHGPLVRRHNATLAQERLSPPERLPQDSGYASGSRLSNGRPDGCGLRVGQRSTRTCDSSATNPAPNPRGIHSPTVRTEEPSARLNSRTRRLRRARNPPDRQDDHGERTRDLRASPR